MDENEALNILQRLAEGIDPHTGEVFPPDSPYQNVQTVRALYTAIRQLEKISRNKRRKITLPERAGIPWDERETDLLIKRFDRGMTINEIAKEHKRTTGAIRSKLANLGKIPDTYTSSIKT